MFPQGQQAFAQWLFGNVGQGLPAYAADLFPNLATTILPSVWDRWKPEPDDAGTQGLLQLLSQGMPRELQSMFGNMMQYGGQGWPGQQMSLAAQYGGAGAPATAMSNVMQFGMPSAAGQPVLDIARTGGSGQWGQMLQNMALGNMPPAGLQYLTPFMGAQPWRSPGMQMPQGRG
jgi:hypothetical protein